MNSTETRVRGVGGRGFEPVERLLGDIGRHGIDHCPVGEEPQVTKVNNL